MSTPWSSTPLDHDPVPLRPVPDSCRTLEATLPRPLTSLVGRTGEVAAVAALLRQADVRLLTLTGPGGVGKTRLAIRIARELGAGFADGVAFVPLAAAREPELALPTIARALGIREAPDLPLADQLVAVLRERQLLLVLDNFEHLTEAAPQITDLLERCPRLTILVTSRARLRLSGEHAFPVPPLSLPDAAPSASPEDVAQAEAVRLFVERASAIDPSFALDATNGPAVAAICRRLDGLPLAIELAAARSDVLPPPALLARLDRSLSLLTSGPRDAPPRLRSMRDAIAWSYDLLLPEEQALFRRSSVFFGGFTLEAAAAVGGDDEKLLDGITALAGASLLRSEAGPGGEPRYLMLETIREFGLERLAESGEAEAARQRHAEHFARFAEPMNAPALAGPDPALALARMDADLENLRAALAWADERGDVALLLRLAAGLEVYWAMRGRLEEARAWLDRALAVAADAPDDLRADALLAAGWIASDQRDNVRAAALTEQALALLRDRGDASGQVEALVLLGIATGALGQFERAQAVHVELFRLLRLLDSPDEPFWTTVALHEAARLALLRGDLAEAERYDNEALVRCRAQGNHIVASQALADLSEIALRRGDYALAATMWRERLDLSWDARGLCSALEGLAAITLARGAHDRAARLYGAAEACRERLGVALEARPRAQYEANIAAARRELGDEVFSAAWADGRRLSPEAARAEAADVARSGASPAAPATSDAGDLGLTRREREVLRLLAEGRSDREIAAALFISPKTAGAHVSNLLAKLSVASRAAAVAYVHRHGLV